GFSSNPMYDVLPEILRRFYKIYPSINIVVKQMSSSEQVQALNEQQIQIGLLCPPIDKTNLFIKDVHEQNFMAVIPEKHFLNNGKDFVSVKELSKESFIMTPRNIGPGYYDTVINICFEVGFSPDIIQEAADLHTSISLVSTGMGVSLVPESLKQYQKKGVVFKKIDSIKTTKIAMAWRQDNNYNVLNNFLKVVNSI